MGEMRNTVIANALLLYRAKSMALVLVFHFLQGGAGSVGSTMVGGTLADIWVTSE